MKFSGLLKGLIIEQGRYEILKKTYAQPKKKGDKVKPARMNISSTVSSRANTFSSLLNPYVLAQFSVL